MNKKIFMIIDDDADDRFAFTSALKEMLSSTECMEAESCEEALRKLREGEQLPHFIFLDVNLPRMNGYGCLKELKSDDKLRGIPVIMYSTSFTEQSIKEFRTLGALSYLHKPTDLSKLPDAIIEAIKRPLKVNYYK